MKRFLMVGIIALMTTGAFAHSPIETTIPADGAALTAAPEQVQLSFKKDIFLTKVEMSFADQKPVGLSLGSQTNFDKAFAFPLMDLGPGTYRINWRGLGKDGHAMTGNFLFDVD